MNDYVREVFANLAYLETEDDSLLHDLKAEGFEAEIRMSAIDGALTKMLTLEQINFCKAMSIAEITAQQAARVINAFHVLHERSERGR